MVYKVFKISNRLKALQFNFNRIVSYIAYAKYEGLENF